MPDMQQDLDQRIRERAYFLWLRAGRPEGMADMHWQQACAEEAAHAASERRADIEDEDSFPASDPPSHTGITGERAA